MATGSKRGSPIGFVWPIVLGLVLGTAAFAGYLFWSQAKTQHAKEVAPGDPALAKPTADECAIARAALSAAHASGADAKWRADASVGTMSLRAVSQVVNPRGATASGYSDDEAEDVRGKGAADWRWCPGFGAAIKALGWSPMTDDEDVAELTLGRAGLNKAGDEAKVYEAFVVPNVDAGTLEIKGGPWLVTLNRSAAGVWTVTPTPATPPAAH